MPKLGKQISVIEVAFLLLVVVVDVVVVHTEDAEAEAYFSLSTLKQEIFRFRLKHITYYRHETYGKVKAICLFLSRQSSTLLPTTVN